MAFSGNGIYHIVIVGPSAFRVDLRSQEASNHHGTVQIYHPNDTAYQMWKFKLDPGGTNRFTICASLLGEKFLQPKDKSSETMKEIEFAQRDHSAFQYWDVTDIGGEIYTLRNEGSGKFMSFGFGSHVKQSGDQDQHTHWRLLPV